MNNLGSDVCNSVGIKHAADKGRRNVERLSVLTVNVDPSVALGREDLPTDLFCLAV